MVSQGPSLPLEVVAVPWRRLACRRQRRQPLTLDLAPVLEGSGGIVGVGLAPEVFGR